ncbi:MAG: hypothetical protein J2P21_16040 [Chloracidobacterium sp.]|nr:hypothetical protein [Chloracidobacterium sp.]
MRKISSTTLMLFVLAGLMVPTSLAQKEGGEKHPRIRQAINALKSAKEDLQNAAHDFCGHRVEALEATNKAINQLEKALDSDRAMNAPAGSSNLQLASYVQPVAVGAAADPREVGMKRGGGERHPMIRRAINQLELAKSELKVAAHDFHGHRDEALEAIDRALNQLKLAIACDKD